MSEFRNRGLRVVVDTIEEAEWYFDSHQISETTRDKIARALKLKPVTLATKSLGDTFVRTICDWDVCYTVSREDNALVVTIIAVELPGEIESIVELWTRAGWEALPEPARLILEGRKRKDDI